MAKHKKNDDLRTWKGVPLFFRYLERSEIDLKKSSFKKLSISIDFYQSENFKPYSYYKPISKIIRPR